jgi:hypothetical protein
VKDEHEVDTGQRQGYLGKNGYTDKVQHYLQERFIVKSPIS